MRLRDGLQLTVMLLSRVKCAQLGGVKHLAHGRIVSLETYSSHGENTHNNRAVSI